MYLGYQALGITAAIMAIGAAYYVLKFALADKLNMIEKSLRSPRHSLVRTVTK